VQGFFNILEAENHQVHSWKNNNNNNNNKLNHQFGYLKNIKKPKNIFKGLMVIRLVISKYFENFDKFLLQLPWMCIEECKTFVLDIL
jgi:hypothetical protein